MKQFLLTYSNQGRGSADKPDAMDRSFNTVDEIEEYLIAQNYEDSFDYHIWKQECGFNLTKNVVVRKTPPILT